MGHVFFVLFLSVYGCMICLVRYLFVISTSVIDCLGRFVPEMTYYVASGTLNLAQLNSTQAKPKPNSFRNVFILYHRSKAKLLVCPFSNDVWRLAEEILTFCRLSCQVLLSLLR